MRYSGGEHTSYAYDPRDLMLSKTLPQGAVSSYQYDALGQVTQIQHANQAGKLLEQLNYAYDPVGNVSQMVRNQESDDEDSSAGGDDSDDSVTSQYTYDALNQLAQVQKQNSADAASSIVTTYAYDNVGNRLSKTSVWGSTTSTEQYSFNAGNQLTHWQSGSEYKDYAYDLRGNLLTVTGDLYDDSSDTGTSAGVVPSVYESSVSQSAYSTTTTVSQSTYTDSADDESSDSGSGILGQYTWNDADQLVKQINERGDMSQYTYDGDGNRMSMTLAIAEGPPSGIGGKGNGKGQGHSNNSGVNPCGHVVPPGFVPPGLAKKCGSSADDPNSYPAGHPVSQRDGWEFEYKKQNWTFNYTNDISSGIAKPIMATDTDPTKWTERYAYGAYDERLSMTYLPANNANDGWEPTPGAWGAQPGTTPKTLYYMNDAEGSALGLMATDGRVSARYHYDEFGTPLDAKKFDPNWSGPDNLFGYTGLGEEYDSGLTFANARYYDPTVGRFISEDSYKGSLWEPQSQNGYAYVENNPINWIDPSGHSKQSDNDELSGLVSDLSFEYKQIEDKIKQLNPKSLTYSIEYFNNRVQEGTLEEEADSIRAAYYETRGLKIPSDVKYIPQWTDEKLQEMYQIQAENGLVTDEEVQEIKYSTKNYLTSKHMVYALKDAEGNVKYVGRTMNPKLRQAIHDKTPGKAGLTFVPLEEGMTYDEARGYEQHYYDLYGGKDKLLNKIRPLSPNNKKFQRYWKAMIEHMGNSDEEIPPLEE